MGYRSYGYEPRWAPYVSVGQKLSKAKKKAAAVAKKQKREPLPVVVQGRALARSFWGKAWCDNLEAYSDFSNRLPRGATYVRNGSVVDLLIAPGKVDAIVAGSDPYTVKIRITQLSKPTWNRIKKDSSASIDSLLDLLAGRFADGTMKRLTQKDGGCFPSSKQIEMACSCPDYSYCCKHIAAVMYAIGSRLDTQPELLFVLRGVDHQELASHAVSRENLDRELAAHADTSLAGTDLGEMFGIELDTLNATESGVGKKVVAKTKVVRKKKVGTRNLAAGAESKGAGRTADKKKRPRPGLNGKKPVKRARSKATQAATLKTPPARSKSAPRPNSTATRKRPVRKK